MRGGAQQPYHNIMLIPAKILAQVTDIPIPRSTDWVPSLLLTILWIFVAAAMIGPLVRHLRNRNSNT